MKTTLLTKLHKRALHLLEMYVKAEEREKEALLDMQKITLPYMDRPWWVDFPKTLARVKDKAANAPLVKERVAQAYRRTLGAILAAQH